LAAIPTRLPTRRTILLTLGLFFWLGTGDAAARTKAQVGGLSGREQDCAALIAYLEAAVEGLRGMQAVIRVVHNRMRDQRFARTACSVVGQDGQFQPMEQRPLLKREVRSGRPLNLKRLLGIDTPFKRMILSQALRLAATAPAEDATKGALYFVNPRLMDPNRCPWFAALRRTTKIGAHFFFTHYREDERRRGPALDCRVAGRDNWMIARNAKNKKNLTIARAKLAGGKKEKPA
jgi:spore germination cell wall hydrolase CwlJ-like protein